MKKFFNIFIEFDQTCVDAIIQAAIANKKKGYVCAVESNNLTYANTHLDFMEVINGAMVNICDGSNIAWILGRIHGQNYRPYVGADLFDKYIQMCRYKQYFLGNTRLVLDGLRKNLSKIDPSIQDMKFEELPFRKVEDFDYEEIARKINIEEPDIIWVSLGAPKQEQFMSMLLPHLKQGIMFGFGAIFNFNSGVGPVKRAPAWMRSVRLEWLYRAYEEPKKNIPRYWKFIKILPRLVKNEYHQVNDQHKT